MSRNRARNVVRNTDIVSKALRTLKGTTGLAWRKIALLDDYSPIPAGTLCAIAKGYPVPKRWRQRLGLPLLIPAPACLKCSQVHVTKKCMANNGNGHRPRRVAIRIDNPESAARTIEKHFGKAFISELIELLDNRHDYY